MKAIKAIFLIIVLILAVLGGGIWYALSNINTIVREQVEVIGSDVLQTDVRLGEVDIKVTEGSGTLRAFSIKNYAGFTQPHFMTFDTVTVDMGLSSLAGDVIVIDKLTVEGVSIVAEQLGKSTNVEQLLDQLKSTDSSEPEPADASESTKEILIAVKELNFIDNTVSLATEKYGTHTAKLPTIVQKNIGSATNGLTPDELVRAIARPLLDKVKERVESELKGKFKAEIKDKLDAKKAAGKEKLKQKLKEKLGDDKRKKLDRLKDLL